MKYPKFNQNRWSCFRENSDYISGEGGSFEGHRIFETGFFTVEVVLICDG